MIRCLITNGSFLQNEEKWLSHARRWMECGVELLQIREPELSAGALANLTREVLRLSRPGGTRVLVNDRADIAIACGADGVHLRDGSVAGSKFARPGFIVTAACHDVESIGSISGVDYILLAPIFQPLSKKEDARPVLGTVALESAVRKTPVPVLALGGVTAANVSQCLAAGAAGIAGISYFDQGRE